VLQARFPPVEYKMTKVKGRDVYYVPPKKIIKQRYKHKASLEDEVHMYQGGMGVYGHPSTGERWLNAEWYVPTLMVAFPLSSLT
jgi:hypothetical protein